MSQQGFACLYFRVYMFLNHPPSPPLKPSPPPPPHRLIYYNRFSSISPTCTFSDPATVPFPSSHSSCSTRRRKTLLPSVSCTDETLFHGNVENSGIELKRVGVGQVRNQVTKLCRWKSRTRKHYFTPGTNLNNILAAFIEVIKQAKEDTLYKIHAGINVTQSTCSEDLPAKYQHAIGQYEKES